MRASFEEYAPHPIYDYFSYSSQGSQIYWSGLSRTLDRGKTWEHLSLAGSAKAKAFSIVFINAEIGFLYGDNDAGIWKTVDAANTWDKIFSGSCYRMWSDNKHQLIAHMAPTSVKDSDFLYSSSDAGKTWKVSPKLKFPGAESALKEVLYLDDGTALASFVSLGPPYHKKSTLGVATSKDNGITWKVIYKKTGLFDEVWRTLVFYDKNSGWALPRSRTSAWLDYFYHTSDGGKTWQKRATPENANFDEVVPLSKDEALMLSWSAITEGERYVYLDANGKMTERPLDCKELETIFHEYVESINKSPTGVMLREAYYNKKLVGYFDSDATTGQCQSK